jgi:hypothetical protein
LNCAEKPQPVCQVTSSNPCEHINAYERPEEARACVLSTIGETSEELPQFVVGRRYTPSTATARSS